VLPKAETPDASQYPLRTHEACCFLLFEKRPQENEVRLLTCPDKKALTETIPSKNPVTAMDFGTNIVVNHGLVLIPVFSSIPAK
jgi:hypothetical protein